MLSTKAIEDVREAVESPTGPEADDLKAGGGWGRRRGRQQQQPQEQKQRQRRQSERRDANPSTSSLPGRSQSKPRRRGGRAAATAAAPSAGAGERAARGEVGEYVPPGGSVELGMFGKKLVSFGQVNLMFCRAFVGVVGRTSGGDACLFTRRWSVRQFWFCPPSVRAIGFVFGGSLPELKCYLCVHGLGAKQSGANSQ